MKYFASLCALVLVGSLPGFATSVHHTSFNPQNQFHFKPTGRRSGQPAARRIPVIHPQTDHARMLSAPRGPVSKIAPRTAQHPASARNVRRHTTNPPTGKVGFLSALDIPAGTSALPVATYYNAYSGDFNGDGTADIASEVETDNSGTTGYAISVVLSNGDGTFKPAVLTPITDTCAAVSVAD